MRLSMAGAAIVSLIALAAPAAAQVTYSYQGNPFTFALAAPYTTSQSVAGGFEVGTALPPGATTDISGSLVGFSFSDGVETRNEANSLICQFSVTTDANGAIVAWDIWLRESGGADPQHSLETRTASDLAGFATPNAGCGPAALNPFASVTGQPGAWSGGVNVIAVPTLSEISLVLLVALLLGSAVWHLRRQAAAR